MREQCGADRQILWARSVSFLQKGIGRFLSAGRMADACAVRCRSTDPLGPLGFVSAEGNWAFFIRRADGQCVHGAAQIDRSFGPARFR